MAVRNQSELTASHFSRQELPFYILILLWCIEKSLWEVWWCLTGMKHCQDKCVLHSESGWSSVSTKGFDVFFPFLLFIISPLSPQWMNESFYHFAQQTALLSLHLCEHFHYLPLSDHARKCISQVCTQKDASLLLLLRASRIPPSFSPPSFGSLVHNWILFLSALNTWEGAPIW